jgi:hypothetical protein
MPRKAEGAAGRRLFSARRGFIALVGDSTVTVSRGDVVDEGDPILKGRAALFEEFVPKVRSYPGQVEQATAAPGEKRNR